MANEENKKRPSRFSEVLGIVAEHVDLFGLEWRYESAQAARRLLAFGIALILGLTAFLLLQIVFVYGLMATGLSLGASAAILAVSYLFVAGIVIQTLGRRDPRAGEPFSMTRRQFSESLTWIQKLFS